MGNNEMVAASKDKTAANSDLGDIALKCLIVLLVIMLLGLQFRLWVGEGSLAEVKNLSDKVVEQRAKNQQMEASNQQLAAEVNALKNGLAEVEARAREELGMVKPGETFYLMIDEAAQ